MLLIDLLLFATTVPAIWGILAKAGLPGWGALIPVYNLACLFVVSGRSAWWVLAALVPFVNIVLFIRLAFDLSAAFGSSRGFGLGIICLPPLFLSILAFGKSRCATV
jgi:uncharacterized protein DUF5684